VKGVSPPRFLDAVRVFLLSGLLLRPKALCFAFTRDRLEFVRVVCVRVLLDLDAMCAAPNTNTRALQSTETLFLCVSDVFHPHTTHKKGSQKTNHNQRTLIKQHTHIYIHNIHTYTHTHIHTYTHTHTINVLEHDSPGCCVCVCCVPPLPPFFFQWFLVSPFHSFTNSPYNIRLTHLHKINLSRIQHNHHNGTLNIYLHKRGA